MKHILTLSVLLALTGCTDLNCEQPTKYEQMPKQKIACDNRGYAYYKQLIHTETYIYTPILANHRYEAYQLKCKDI